MTTEEKCFAITAAFEGGGYGALSGNFDGQGISFGFLQWNLGRGTLQPLLLAMYAEGPATFVRCFTQPVETAPFNSQTVNLAPDILRVCRELGPDGAVAWAEGRQDSGHRLLPHWVKAFKAISAEPGFQKLQRRHAAPYMNRARGYMATFGFKTERALALLFDICVQMGSIGPGSRARYAAATVGRKLAEPQKLEALARTVAPQGGRWAADVLSRKLTIALGKGIVHGRPYNIAKDFGLADGPLVF
jgi:hypothetical protein